MSGRPGERILKPRPLTAEAFAAYGDVIEARGQPLPINRGHTLRYDALADIDAGAEGGRPVISLFRSTPLAMPIEISVMENHPLGSQAFMPLSGRPYLVAVAQRGAFNAETIEVFRAAANQGVSYAKGVWHHYLLALDAQSDFLVVDRAGPGNNLEEIEIPAAARPRIAL